MKLNNFLACFITLVLMCPEIVGATDSGFNTVDEVDDWYKRYYRIQDSSRTGQAVKFFGREMYDKENSRPHFAYFISQIIKTDQKLMDFVYEDVMKSEEIGPIAVYLNALWFLDTEHSRELLKKAKQSVLPDIQETASWLLDNFPASPLLIKELTPGDLDLLWSHYFATGEIAAIGKIVSALAYSGEKNSEKLLTYGAARWSLIANCKENIDLQGLSQDQLVKSDGVVEKELKEVVKECGI